VVDRIPQGADTRAGKEIQKDALHRVSNRNGIGHIDGVGHIKVIQAKSRIIVLHDNMLSRSQSCDVPEVSPAFSKEEHLASRRIIPRFSAKNMSLYGGAGQRVACQDAAVVA
jgi:hypothetical protein